MADEIIFKLTVDMGDSDKQIDAFKAKLAELKKEMESAFASIDFKFPGFSGFGDSLLPSFTGVIGKATDIFISGFKGIFDGIVGLAKGAFDVISGIVSTAFDGFKDALANSIALEDAMSGVKRTGNLTGEQLQQLTEDVRDMSVAQLKGAVSSEELAKVLETAGQQGLISSGDFEKSKDVALEFAKGVAMTAGALDMSFEKTADSLGKFSTLMKIPAEDIAKVGNAINVLADTTNAAADSTTEMAKRLAPAASQYKMAASDVIGFAAAMDSMGVSAYTGATALQRVLGSMTNNIDGFAQGFQLNATKLRTLAQTDIGGAIEYLVQGIQKMATSTPDGMEKVAQALKDLGVSGAGVSTAFLGLAGMGAKLQADFLDPAAAAIQNTDSITNEFGSTTSRLSSIWGSMGEIFANTAGKFTDVLLPIFEEALTWIRDIAIAFSGWVTSQGIIETIETSVRKLWEQGIKPLFESLKDSALNDFGNEAKTIFAEWLPAAIETTIGWMTQAAQKVDEWLPELIGYAGDAWRALNELGATIKSIFTEFANSKGSADFFSKTLPDAFQTAKQAMKDFGPAVKEVIGFFRGIISTIREMEPLFSAVGETWDDVIGTIRRGTEPLFQLIVDLGMALGDLFAGDFVKSVEGALKAVVDLFKNMTKMMWDITKQVFGGIADTIKGEMGKAVDWLAEKMKGLTNMVNGLGEVAYRHSVFPDIAHHVGLDAQAVNQLRTSVSEATSTLAHMGQVGVSELASVATTAQKVANATRSIEGNFAPKPIATPQETQRATLSQTNTPATPHPTGRRGGGAVGGLIKPTYAINFIGQNVLDESAKNRFARKTVGEIAALTKRSIII